MSEVMIKNVTEFVEVIRQIETNDETELFFHGHADCVYEAEPTIFRKNKQGERSHLQNEKYLFNDIVTQCPEEFKDCQYTFEYLVKMQHYGLPTRLLDITSNALVALYFACCSLDDFMHDGKGNIVCDKDGKEIDQRKDGQVLVYRVRKDAIKNYNSDTVSVLSNLTQLDSDFELFTKDQLEYVQENKEFLKHVEETMISFQFLQGAKKFRQTKDIRVDEIYDIQLKKYKEILRELLASDECNKIADFWFFDKEKLDSNEKNYKQNVIDIDEEQELIQPYLDQLKSYIKLIPLKERFLHFIKREKSYFVDKINLEGVQKIICVRAKLNNPRIIRQSGLFFLFGMGNTKGEPITFPEYINELISKARNKQKYVNFPIQEITIPKILISGQAKKDIIEELCTLGISDETLMPEMENVAKSIKDRYSH